MNPLLITSSVELGLLYGLMTLGLFISYRILDIPDLTVDGSFTLGAAVSVVVATMGHPILGIFLAGIAGSCAGVVTATLQTKLKVQPILAGILTMTALYSINIMVMSGKPNMSFRGIETIFSKMKTMLNISFVPMILGISIVILVMVVLALFLSTQLGLAIRATGDNEDMVRSSSVNVDFTKTVGLAIANSLVGVSGALIAQYQSYTDVSMGVGMVVMGIASLIIGEVIFGRKSIRRNIVAAILGSIIYRLIISLAIEFNISASSMKLITAIIVTIAISYPVLKGKIKLTRQISLRKSKQPRMKGSESHVKN